MIDLLEQLDSGLVVRYHANPLITRKQTLAEHQQGMQVIIDCIYEVKAVMPYNNIIKACRYHDAGEYKTGDFPYHFKRNYPKLAKQIADCEDIEREKMGIPPFELRDDEKKWLKLADRLEAVWYIIRQNGVAEFTRFNKDGVEEMAVAIKEIMALAKELSKEQPNCEERVAKFIALLKSGM